MFLTLLRFITIVRAEKGVDPSHCRLAKHFITTRSGLLNSTSTPQTPTLTFDCQFLKTLVTTGLDIVLERRKSGLDEVSPPVFCAVFRNLFSIIRLSGAVPRVHEDCRKALIM
jgi:hypothetical protein